MYGKFITNEKEEKATDFNNIISFLRPHKFSV